MRSRPRWIDVTHDRGVSLTELIVTVSVMATAAAASLPLVAYAVDTTRERQAAAFVAGKLRAAQQAAVATSRATGLVFDWTGSRWTFRVCEDGNRNGVRRAELPAGPDRCEEGPFDLTQMFRGVAFDVDATLVGPGGEPGSPDPIRFGAADIATFSADGGARAGSVFLKRADGRHFVVRVSGVAGRIRVLRYDPETSTWEAL